MSTPAQDSPSGGAASSVVAALAPAPSCAALAFWTFLGLQHRLALVGPGIRETIPPRCESLELTFELAAPAAKVEKVPAGAKAGMLEQPVGTLAGALLEARLQRPDFLDGRLEPARDRNLLRLLGEHGVHRLEQRGNGFSAAGARRLPRREHLVPEECRKQEPRRGAPVLAHTKIGVGERELDESLAERLLQDHVDQRQEAVREAVRAQASERLDRVARKQELLHFVEEPRRGHVLHQRRELRDRRRRLRMDRDVEFRGEPHGPQHPHRILAQAGHRRADHFQLARADVGHAADVIPHFLLGRVEVQRVDREVAPRRVLHLRAIHVVRQQPAVFVGCVVAGLRGAKRRDFDGFGAGMDVHEPKTASDDEGTAEERLHLLGPGVGGDVEILGLDAEQEIAHCAADDEGLEPGLVQAPRDVERPARQLMPADRVVGGAVDPGLSVTVPSG